MKLVEELPAAKPPRVTSEAAFSGSTLEASLDFAASPDALSVVKQFKHSVEQKRIAEVKGREAVISTLNKQRCSAAPLFGQDAVKVLRMSG